MWLQKCRTDYVLAISRRLKGDRLWDSCNSAIIKIGICNTSQQEANILYERPNYKPRANI
ncbi:MAG: hypothetical protein ACOYMQ_14905 [Pseudanabaena sp.]|jgi:hypothetical protein